MSGRRWSPDEDERLRDLVANGQTLRAASREIGRSWHATRHRAKMLGIKPPYVGEPPHHDKRARVLRMVAAGYSVSAIARETGVQTSAVRTMIHKLIRLGALERSRGRYRLASAYRFNPSDEARGRDVR